MKIVSEFTHSDKVYTAEYEDCDDYSVLPNDLCTQIYGACFYEGKMVVGLEGSKPHWKFVGGTREEGETVEETLTREVLEESNMDVLEQVPIGYQKVTREDGYVAYQLRSWCRVKPRGPFVSDPAGSVKEIKLIDPKDCKKYFDWGEIGDRIMERAIEIEARHHIS